MTKTQVPDYWELETRDQRAVLGEFKKTTRGTMISLARLDFTEVESEWINSFRIFPTLTISISEVEKTDESQLLVKAKELTKTRLRLERAPLLVAQDVLFQRAQEASADTTAIVAEKNRLRDITDLADAATTLEQLRALKAEA